MSLSCTERTNYFGGWRTSWYQRSANGLFYNFLSIRGVYKISEKSLSWGLDVSPYNRYQVGFLWCTFIVHLPHSEAKLQLETFGSNLLCKFVTRSAATSVSNGFPSLGAPLRSATGAMTQCNDSNVYWHPIVLNTLLKISYSIYDEI